MTYKTLREIFKICLIVFGLLIPLILIFFLGQVIVFGDYLKALDALQELERTGILPSETDPFIVDIIKNETELWGGNTEGLKKYIEPMRKGTVFMETCLISVTITFVFLLVLRLYFRKSRFQDTEKVTWKKSPPN